MKISAVVMALGALAVLGASGGCDSTGTLVCPAGAVLCGAQCSNVQGDPDNCGACGTVCPHGSLCDLGACTSAGYDAGLPEEASASTAPTDASNDTGSTAVTDGAMGGQ